MNVKALLSIGKQIKDNCPNIKHIDIYNGQYTPDNDGMIKPFTKPAALLEFGQTAWTDTDGGIQEGEGLLRVHVVVQKLNDTFKLFDKDNTTQQAMTAHYSIPVEVHVALEGFLAEGTLSKLHRVNTIPDHDYHNTIVEVHEYEFRDLDDSADEQSDWVTVHIDDVLANGSIE